MTRQAGPVLNGSDIYREWAPPPAWEPVVACCWEQRVSAGRVQRVLPDGRADLIIYDSGQIEVVGLHDQAAFHSWPRAPICEESGSVQRPWRRHSRCPRRRYAT